MKKHLPIILSVLFSVIALNLQAQDTIRSLIFSEWAGINRYNNYVELTNVGEDTVDLSDFTLAGIAGGDQFIDDGFGNLTISLAPDRHLRLSGKLPPDSSYLIMNVFDGLQNDGSTYHRMGMLEIADEIVHYDNKLENIPSVIDPEREIWDFDSLSVHHFVMRLLGGLYGNVLFYNLPNGDSVMVDAVNLNLEANTAVYAKSDVAGIFEATGSHILVRKADTPDGEPDWRSSRGVGAEDSEWIPVPFFPGDKIYSTVRTHGDFNIEIASETIEIDLNDSSLLVPWGIYKGETIIEEFTLGDGIGWQYVQDTTSVEDSAHVISQTGDILQIFACGNDLEWINFDITIKEPETNMAQVFPLSYKYYPDQDDPSYYWSTPYYVTEDEPGMDTIGNVLYRTRVDSLIKYLEMAPGASWEIIWIDAMERADLKEGDILKVTAADGTTAKEYFIDVHDYYASGNAQLAAITWPDKNEFMEGWVDDTVPSFNSNKTYYNIILPYGTVRIPALRAIPQNINARINENRATNLQGGLEQRSTIFTVTAEDDSTVIEYTVTFEIERPDENIQKYYGDPFISEMILSQWGVTGHLEIVNPRNLSLDLSEYMFVTSSSNNPADAIEGLVPEIPTEDNFKYRYAGYVPGYKYYDDTLNWINNAGKLLLDIDVDPVLKPGGVFVSSMANSGREAFIVDRTPWVYEIINKLWAAPTAAAIDPDGVHVYTTPPSLRRIPTGTNDEAVFIFKILNDSVLEGTKKVGDPLDYKVVDIVGDPVLDGFWDMAGRQVAWNWKARIKRKPSVYKGVTELGQGMGTDADNSEWTVEKQPEDIADQNDLTLFIGSHTMDQVTAYMSTISSVPYLVSDGWMSPQTIQGDLSGTTVSNFYDNLQKADTGQALILISGTSGLELDLIDPVGDNDTLVVTSADSSNETRYVLIDQPLDDDALIVVKPAYTGSYSVNVEGADGTITGSGIQWGVPVKEIMAALMIPAKATYAIIDKEDKLVPLQVRNFDDVYSDVRINDSIFLEVRAQDGTTIITYQLKPESGSGDAFVVSSTFLVDQNNHTIGLVPSGIGVATFLDNINAVTGATMKVLDKFGFERPLAIMNYDDKLQVVSEDGTNTVYYYLNFLDEKMPDNNTAPTLVLNTPSANILIGGTVNLTASAEDDGMPLPANLNVLWDVVNGDAGSVSIANPDMLVTDATFSATGTYQLRITVDDGEISSSQIATIGVSTPDNAAPTVSVASASFTIIEGESINVSATADDDGNPVGSSLSYLWTVKTGVADNVNIVTADQLNSEVSFSTEGVYTLQITVSDEELVATDIVVVVVNSTVGIEPTLSPALKLYPNPVHGMLNIEMMNIEEPIWYVKIFNLTGQLVFNARLTQNMEQIDVSSFKSGMYYVTVKSGKYVFNKRIQVVR